MTKPLISIIIPTFNRAQIIQQAIDSVLAQSYTHWECLVIDDGSQDETLDVLKKYRNKDSRIIYFERQREPKGAPTCRNIGLEHAQGNYIIFLDSDDYLLDFCLEQRVKAINKFPNCGFLVFPMGEMKGNTIVKKEIPEYDDYLVPFLSANILWQTMCPIWRREFLLILNGFTVGYSRFTDPELMIRAFLQENKQYKIFNDFKHDSVHIPNQNINIQFLNKVYKSLLLFIPDISKQLEIANKLNYKKYLALYLHLWFKYFYVPEGTNKVTQSFNLIFIFKGLGIITLKKTLSISLRLCVFSFSKLILKHPIDKLSEKAIYK